MGGIFSRIFASLFGAKETRILILGLDGAGKTTILYRLQVGEVVTTIPIWDLGGQTSIRPYWRCYYANTDVVIYVVDSQDKERISISKQELLAMLEEEELRKTILCVFANKQYKHKTYNKIQQEFCLNVQRSITLDKKDMEGAMTAAEVSNALGLSSLKTRTWSIFKTSATKGEGLTEAMDWLVDALKARQ